MEVVKPKMVTKETQMQDSQGSEPVPTVGNRRRYKNISPFVLSHISKRTKESCNRHSGASTGWCGKYMFSSERWADITRQIHEGPDPQVASN